MFPYRQFSIRSILLLLVSFAVAGAALTMVGPPDTSTLEMLMVMGCLGIVIFFPCDALLDRYSVKRYYSDGTDVRDIVLVWAVALIVAIIWVTYRFDFTKMPV